MKRRWRSSDSVASMDWMTGFNPRLRIFLLALVYSLALGPTQIPSQTVPVVLNPGVQHGRSTMLTTEFK